MPKEKQMIIQLQGVDEVLATLNPQVTQKALSRTINELGSKMRTQMTKEVRKTYNIKAKDIKQKMKIKRSKYSTLKYVLDVEGKTLNAMRFDAKKLKARGQVSLKIKKANGRRIIQRAFMAKNGAVLQRVKGTKQIRAVQTLSIPQMFNDKIVEQAKVSAGKDFTKTFERNFSFYIDKYG